MGTPVTPCRSRAALAFSGLRSQTATSSALSSWERTFTCVWPTVLVPITAARHFFAIDRTPAGSNACDCSLAPTACPPRWRGRASHSRRKGLVCRATRRRQPPRREQKECRSEGENATAAKPLRALPSQSGSLRLFDREIQLVVGAFLG